MFTYLVCSITVINVVGIVRNLALIVAIVIVVIVGIFGLVIPVVDCRRGIVIVVRVYGLGYTYK